MEVLVDTSIWIDYFKSGENSEKLDYLISENLVRTNALILAELLPLLILKKHNKLVNLLQKINKHPLDIDWDDLSKLQVECLKSGASGIGIPDLIIAQHAIQNKLPIYTLDKHFRFMIIAGLNIQLYA